MESVFKCGDCGEVLPATALTENGGCRVIYHIEKHICLGVDQEQEDEKMNEEQHDSTESIQNI